MRHTSVSVSSVSNDCGQPAWQYSPGSSAGDQGGGGGAGDGGGGVDGDGGGGFGLAYSAAERSRTVPTTANGSPGIGELSTVYEHEGFLGRGGDGGDAGGGGDSGGGGGDGASRTTLTGSESTVTVGFS